MNTLSDLLNSKQMDEYQDLGYPDNLKIIQKALDKKLSIDEDYEVFLPLIYLKCRTKANNQLYCSNRTFISNKGNIYTKEKGIEKPVTKYYRVKKPNGKTLEQVIIIKRAIGSTFIYSEHMLGTENITIRAVSKDPDGRDVYENIIWVNAKDLFYKDGKKILAKNKDRTKCIDTDPDNTVKFEIMYGKLKGLVFLLNKDNYLKGFGCRLNDKKLREKNLSWFNCLINPATKEDVLIYPFYRTFKDEFKTEIKSEINKVKVRSRTIYSLSYLTGEIKRYDTQSELLRVVERSGFVYDAILKSKFLLKGLALLKKNDCETDEEITERLKDKLILIANSSSRRKIECYEMINPKDGEVKNVLIGPEGLKKYDIDLKDLKKSILKNNGSLYVYSLKRLFVFRPTSFKEEYIGHNGLMEVNPL